MIRQYDTNLIGRERELADQASTLRARLPEPDAELLDRCYHLGGGRLTCAEHMHWQRFASDRPWTPEAAAYRDALAELQDFRIRRLPPLDASAAAPCPWPYTWLIVRGD